MDPNRWLKEAGRSVGRPLRLAVALGTAGGVLLIVQAGLLAHVVNAVVFGAGTLRDMAPFLAGLLGVFTVRAAIAWLAEWTAFRGAAAVKLQARHQLTEHLFALGPVRLADEHSGALANALTDAVEALEPYYARFLPQMALAALVPLALLAVVFPLDWVSGLILLVTAPLIPAFMILIGKGAESLNQRQWRRLAGLSAHFLDTLQGLTTLKLFNASRREAAAVARLSEDYRRSTMAVLRVAFVSALALEFLATVSIALVAVLIGFRLLWGELGFQAGFLVLLLAPEFYLPLRSLGTHYHARMDAIAAAERLTGILQRPAPARSGRQPAPATGPVTVELADLRYAYEPGRSALEGVSFTLRPGERVALVGPSGAGKSTVINLLLGFIQSDSGRLAVNGRSLDELDYDSWLQQVAWVPQNPRLFHATVRENIALGGPLQDEARVREAARQALAEAFIEQLPLGYDTVIGEGGQPLSGGQAQRLALARAFFKQAPLVLLDEPSANLDLDSERRIAAAVDRLAEGRTLLSIAHRLATVRRADRILVLDQGRIVQTGTHAALAAEPGLYQHLVHSYTGAP